MPKESTLKSLYKFIKQRYNAILKIKLQLKLNNCNDFYYKYNWGRENYPIWDKLFAPLIGKENLNYLEIGTQEGRSAVWLLTNILTHESARLTCIDPMHGTDEVIFKHNINLSGAAHKVTLIKKYSDEALVYLPENSFDFIYIDGGHQAIHVLADSVYSWELLKKDGYLLFDDYLWGPENPKHLRCQYPIDLFLKNYQDKIEVIFKEQQVLVKKLV